MYLNKRNFNFFDCCVRVKLYYLTGGCVVIVTLLLTSTEVSQVDNMSKSQCCPLYCHGGGRRALHRWRPH